MKQTNKQTKLIYFSIITFLFLLFSCPNDVKKPSIEDKAEDVKVTISYSTTNGTAPLSKTVNSGYKLTEDDLISLSAEDFIFEGWYIDEEKIYSGYTVITNITLVAKWTEIPIPEIKTITYVLNGGVFDDPSLFPTEYKAGDYINFEEAYKHITHSEEYSFGGFYSDEKYTHYIEYVDSYKFPRGLTLYAKWYIPNSIKCILTTITDNSITFEFTIPSIKTQLDYIELICNTRETNEKKSVLLYDVAVDEKIIYTFTNLDNTKSYYVYAIIHDKNGISSSYYREPISPANPEYTFIGDGWYPYNVFSVTLPDHIYLDKSLSGKNVKISTCEQTQYYTYSFIFKSKDKITWEHCSSSDEYNYVVEDGTTYFLAFCANVLDQFSFSQICEVTCSDKYDSIGQIYYTDGTYSQSLDDAKTIAGIIVDCDKNNKPTKIMSISSKKCVFNSNPNQSSVTYDVIGTDGENNWEIFKMLDEESYFEAYNFVNNLNIGELKWYIPAAPELLTVLVNKSRIEQGYMATSSSLNFSIWSSNAVDSWEVYIATGIDLRDNIRCWSENYAYGFAKIQ